MGYSCSAKASMVLEALESILKETYNTKCSNGLVFNDGVNGHFEIGREHRSGAITGKVMKACDKQGKFMVNGTHCLKVGSFKINTDGKIAGFAGINKAILRKAETMGLKRFAETWFVNDKGGCTRFTGNF